MILGISGRIGSGKDTVASWLVRERGFVIVRFSDALKEEVFAKFRGTLAALWRLHYQTEPAGHDLSDLVHHLKPQGVRELLQEFGTDVRRDDDPSYWVRRWAERIAPHVGAFRHTSVVAPDVRFPNEAQIIRKLGGRVWRIARSGPKASGHISESMLDGFDGSWNETLDNNGTIHDLEQTLARLVPQEQHHADPAPPR